MNRTHWLGLALVFLSLIATAQDEGAIVKKERINLSKGIFLGGGPSFTLGENIGDYSSGINFELGFLKRVNRVLSIGPSVSYISFKYDPDVTNVNGGAYVDSGDPNGWAAKYALPGLEYYYGYVLTLQGGDLSLISAACNLKFNFIPITDNTKFSVYGFAKPFVTYASRTDVTGHDDRYTYEIYEDFGSPYPYDDVLYYNTGDETWYLDGTSNDWGPDNYPALEADSEITGGIFIGPGIEFMPSGQFSVYAQAAFGYTFPITFVSTESYGNTVADYSNEEFPMVKKGFPSVNIQIGVSFNF